MHRLIGIALAALMTSSLHGAGFQSARPIWPAGREKEKNLTVGFRATFDAPPGERVVLRAAASTIYRAFTNDRFCAHGPARGPHGFFRVDEWDITPLLKPGANIVAIEVAGYNANSYAYLDQPSFLQAEVVSGGKVLASTVDGEKGFVAGVLSERVQKVQRYSFQRPFSEVYRLKAGYDAWRANASAAFGPAKCGELPALRLLERRVPNPDFTCRPALWHVASGTMVPGPDPAQPWKDRSLTGVGPKLAGYPEQELEVIPSLTLQKFKTGERRKADVPLDAAASLGLPMSGYHIVDLGTNLTGFIGLTVACEKPTRLYLTFDEILAGDDVDYKRLGCVNIILLEMQPGTYHFETMEPYTLRYLKPLVLEGSCRIENIHLRELASAGVSEAQFASSDVRLNRLFEAGRETFRQNALDIFMDCPSRERAGWLCDSFFTSRVAMDLQGHTRIEQNFCENFMLPEKFPFLADGMLPMCYPADHNDTVFIPNWAMWFVVELEEYLARSGDRRLVDALKPRVTALLNSLRKFRNDDGLLEKLPSWVFVEWSAANGFVQDVNYPSNMLWAGTLAAAGRMYRDETLTDEAAHVSDTIRRQSFDGHFFVDNAVRKEGKLQVTRNRTETCQYYAFFFDVATPKTHAELWRVLTDEFGPKRMEQKKHPEIHPSNSFIGNMLRMEILSRYGRAQQILDESIGYLLYMADRTGTLWENVSPEASCNHGFASHIVHTLYRDILGLREVDTVGKRVRLQLADVNLAWCEGRLPTPDGPITSRWWKEAGKLHYRLDVPAGYRIEETHPAGIELVRHP